MEGYGVPEVAYQHEMLIDIDATAQSGGTTTEVVYSNLRTLIATVTQVTLEFGSESRTVTVDRENTAFLTELDAYTASTAPNALAIRKGVLRLVLIEKIAIS